MGGGREKAKQCSRSLSPLGRNPPPARSPLCEVCGRTFITLMALLRVNSHCSSTHELAGPCPDPATSSSTVNPGHPVSNVSFLQAVTPAPELPSSIFLYHSRAFLQPPSYKTFSPTHRFPILLLKRKSRGQADCCPLLGLTLV